MTCGRPAGRNVRRLYFPVSGLASATSDRPVLTRSASWPTLRHPLVGGTATFDRLRWRDPREPGFVAAPTTSQDPRLPGRPGEVESVLAAHPGGAAVAVVAREDQPCSRPARGLSCRHVDSIHQRPAGAARFRRPLLRSTSAVGLRDAERRRSTHGKLDRAALPEAVPVARRTLVRRAAHRHRAETVGPSPGAGPTCSSSSRWVVDTTFLALGRRTPSATSRACP